MNTAFRKSMAHLILIVVSLVFVMPFLWMVVSSFKSNQDIFVFPPVFIPKHWLWSNYLNALKYIPFFHYLWNTFFVTIANVIGTLVSTPPVAYSFSKLEWKGRDVVFGICLSTIMLPFLVTMIPLYTMFRHWGWIDTFWPLIVPAFFGSPMYIFLLRQFYLGLPKDLMDAAKIDGAGELRTFWLLTPLTKPALISISLFTFLGTWTDFLSPLIFLNSSDKFTMSLGLQQYQSIHSTAWAYLMAACVVFTVPVVILFFILQRYFVEGISFSGVKG